MRRFNRSVVIASVGALCAASIDGSMGFISAGGRFSSPAHAAVVLASTALVAFLAILIIRWLIVAPLSWFRLDGNALSVATAVGVATLFVVYDISSTHTGIELYAERALDGLLAIVMAAGWYSLSARDGREPRPTLARVIGRILSFVMPLAAAAIWLVFVKVNDVTSVPAAIIFIALAGITLGLAVMVRIGAPRWWGKAMAGMFVLVMIAGVAGFLSFEKNQAFPMVPTDAHAEGKVKQVIFLSVDTLRRDSVSCFGSKTVQTPHIDSIAQDGAMFRNLTASSSWTSPSFASMMTGLPTAAHGVVSAAIELPDTIVTLPERFHEAGYATYGVIGNSMLAAHRGFARGFDRYDIRDIPITPVCIGEVLSDMLEHKPVDNRTTTRDVTNLAIEWSRTHKNDDFFLWVHYYDPHLPYSPPKRYVEHMNIHDTMGYSLEITSLVRPTSDLFGEPAERAWARSLYDGEVRYVDDEIGRFLDSLKESGIYNDALLVFAVDHGEEFWDHDGFEHGHSLYNELIGVPFMIKLPGAHQGKVIDDAVSGYDVAPTILDICGLPPVNTPTGISLAGRVNDTVEELPDRPLFSGGTLFRSNWESVVFDGWKYIRSMASGRESLFRLADDPEERKSLVLDFPEITQRGRDLLDEHQRAMEVYREESGITNPQVKMDADELERLRTLGYL